MEKLDEQKMTIDHHGVDMYVKAIRWDYGSYEEIDINHYDDYSERYHTKFIFRVTDTNDRLCRFRATQPTDVGEPDEIALKAIAEYGYRCENFDIETLVKHDIEKFQPFLQYIDDAFGTALEGRNVPWLTDHPFLADLIEASQSPVAMCNGLVLAAEDIGNGDREQGLEMLVSEEHRDILRMHLLQAMQRDPYMQLFVPALAEHHFDIEFDQEELELGDDYGGIPAHLRPMLDQANEDLKEKVRPGSYGAAHSPLADDG